MEQKRCKTWLIVAIVLGLLLSCACTAVAGLTGYALGRRSGASHHLQFRLEPFEEEQVEPGCPRLPLPKQPRLPDLDLDLDPDAEIPIIWPLEAEIVEVIEGSPAEEAGLEVGDRIVAVDDELMVEAELTEMMTWYDPGDRVELTILRDGEQEMIAVKLGRHPDRGGETAWLGVGYRMVPSEMVPRLRRFRTE